MCVYGGAEKAYVQFNEIQRVRPEIIVATPGRLIDLLDNYGLKIDQSKY